MTFEPRFLPAFALLISGFLIWAAHFLLIYSFTGLMCARPEWAQAEVGGVRVIPLGIAAITALAMLALTAVLAWNGLLSSHHDSGNTITAAPFYRQFTLGAALLSAVAIVWEGLFSIAFVPSCQ